MKIVYRIVAALAALLTVPALFFIKLVQITVHLGFTDGYFHDSFSLYDFYKIIEDRGINAEDFALSGNISKTLAPLKTTAIITLVFLCLMIVMILAVFFCSALTNARKVNIVLAIVGAISVIGLMVSFDQMTKIIVNGTVGLDAIINSLFADSQTVLGSLAALLGVGSLVSVIGELEALRLTSATIIVLFLFIFVAIWAAAFVLIDLDENKLPKEKKQHPKKKKHK